jgi:hypothetical protein
MDNQDNNNNNNNTYYYYYYHHHHHYYDPCNDTKFQTLAIIMQLWLCVTYFQN